MVQAIVASIEGRSSSYARATIVAHRAEENRFINARTNQQFATGSFATYTPMSNAVALPTFLFFGQLKRKGEVLEEIHNHHLPPGP